MGDELFIGIISFLLGVAFMGSALFVFTYPLIGENNAVFFCEFNGLVVKDFEQDRGSLVFVECEEPIEVVVPSDYYWKRVGSS